jgi:hypothetical protein
MSSSKIRLGILPAKNRFYQNVKQAEMFFEKYNSLLNEKDKNCLADFAALKQQHWFKKRGTLIKHNIYKCGLRKNIGIMLGS